MKATDFASASGRLRVLEKRMLTAGGLERIIDAESGHEAMHMLSQNSSFDFSTVEKDGNYESVLRSELTALYQLAYQLTPDARIVDLLCAKYDYHNLKLAVKSRHTASDMDDLSLSFSKIPPETVKALLTDPKAGMNVCPDALIQAAKDAAELFAENPDPQALDIFVDLAQYSYMSNLSKEIGNEMIQNYVESAIDFYNVKTLMRVKNMEKGPRFLAKALANNGSIQAQDFVSRYDRNVDAIGDSLYYKNFGASVSASLEDYEKAGNFAALEKAADNYLLDIVKQAKYITFGPETIFAYVVAKENEIKQVRILLTCKFNRISDDVIRERLRDNYA